MSSPLDSQKHILDSLKTVVLLINAKFEVIWINSSAEEFFQISKNQIKTRPIIDFFEKKELIRSALERLQTNYGSIIIKEIAITANQQRNIATCALNPIFQAEKKLNEDIVASVEITLEKKFSILDFEHDDQTGRTNNQTLIQGMGHEIKNPLGGIRGAAQLLSANLTEREDKDYLNIILHETQRLNQLVDRMSGHIKDKRMLPINIHRILEHIFKLLAADKKNNLLIKRDYDPSLPEITGSETALTQAFLNLALNASQAIENSGEIILRSRLMYGVVIKDQQYRQAIRIDIQDNGPGIDETIKANIFEPLISSKAQGTGIGLSITREIIAMHNGKIEFSSRPGKTVFGVYLPIMENKT